MCMPLMFEINVYLPNFSNRVIGFINFERPVSKLYRRHNSLVSQFNVEFRICLHEGLWGPGFYDELI